MRTVPKPEGLFKGENFMTPRVLGYYRLRKSLGYAELSRGEGFKHEPIFGVTIQWSGSEESNHALSKMFWSMGEALNYIGNLSD